MDVGHLPDMDNPIRKYFEFPLRKGELLVALLVLDVLCWAVHIDGRRQKCCYTICSDRDNSQNKTKTYVDFGSLRSKLSVSFCVWSPSHSLWRSLL